VGFFLRAEGRGTPHSAEHSMDKIYINVTGGPRDSAGLGIVAAELSHAAFGDLISIVPGPLMRATHGKALGHSHMPLSPQSTYEMIHSMMDEAYRLANPEGDRDSELDLQGLASPL
jgi:hypothetical protein